MSDGHDIPDPTRPEGAVAAYILDGIDRQSDVETLREIANYALGRANRLEALEAQEVDTDDVVDSDEQLEAVEKCGSMGAIVEKKIPCGKDCSGCPHGPYKYRVYREGDSVKTEYLGPA